jgi:hypothetical protein
MKPYQLNTAVHSFDVTIVFAANTLMNKGWEFDMTEKEAEECAAIVRIIGERDEDGFPYTSVELNIWADQNNKISNGIAEHTGDDEASINDIIELLNDGQLTIPERDNGDYSDMSTDDNGNYIPAFVTAEQEQLN